jgi:hypothetical protein
MEMKPRERTWTWRLSACYRVQNLALAVLYGGEIIEVRRHRVDAEHQAPGVIALLIRQLVEDYALSELIIEEGPVLEAAADFLPVRVHTLSLQRVKQHLLPEGALPTYAGLYHQLLKEHPKLQRFVTVLKGTGQIATSERWKTVMLLAVALGLAAPMLGCQDLE